MATLAVIPKYEKDKQGRKAEKLVKDRSKSTGAKRCLVVGRIDAVPENRTNVKVLIENLDLPEIKKDFAVVADLKLIDILCGFNRPAVFTAVHIVLGTRWIRVESRQTKRELG